MHKKTKRDRRLVRLEMRLKQDVQLCEFINSLYDRGNSMGKRYARLVRRLQILQNGTPGFLWKPVNVHELELWKALEKLSHPQFIVSTKGAPEPEINLDDVIQIEPVFIKENEGEEKKKHE